MKMYVKSALLMLAINLPGKDVPAGPSPVPIDLDGESAEVSTFPAQTTAYDYSKLRREKLGRGLVAWRSATNKVSVGWRYLSSDPPGISFDVYRDGELIAKSVSAATQVDDSVPDGGVPHRYALAANGETVAETASHTTLGYVEIPLPEPPPGDTAPDGTAYMYFPGDCSVGDVDGDGEYEIFLKWDPSLKGSFNRYSGETYYECLKLDGTSLWRISMGRNIRSGEHCSDFSVADFDGDGKAEMIVKTADGTTDGVGNVIGDPTVDWRNENGQVLAGPEYISVFDGLTGRVLCTVDYLPARGPVSDWTSARGWGDKYGNRVERYLLAPAYLDGERLSCVACRGIYKRSAMTAYDWDGKSLSVRWMFDTTNTTVSTVFQGQGFHSLRVGDVDGDGRDEIVYGSMAVDHDGSPLYSTGLGHGDAMHLLQMDPRTRGLQVFVCLESSPYGCALYEASTGEIRWRKTAGQDTPRAVAGDIDAANPGCEAWAAAAKGLFDQFGTSLVPYDGKKGYQGLSFSHLAWWTGTLERSLVSGTNVVSYSLKDKARSLLAECDGVTTINSTKAVPALQGDILGDWREELIFPTLDGRALRIFISPEPTEYRFHTFLEDPVYRHSIAHQNGCYNQPTQPGFYFGPDLKGHGIWFRGCRIP